MTFAALPRALRSHSFLLSLNFARNVYVVCMLDAKYHVPLCTSPCFTGRHTVWEQALSKCTLQTRVPPYARCADV